MPRLWRTAAKRALGRLPPAEHEGAALERAVFDVTADGRTELVTVTMRDGELVTMSTGGGPQGPHVRAVLRLLAGEAVAGPAAREAGVPGLAPEASQSLPPGAVRTLSGAPAPVEADRLALAEALSDVVTAVVRVGLRQAAGAPSVDETLERVVRSAPRPLPIGVARWVGRLRSALVAGDGATVALLLQGASQLAADLRGGRPTAEGMARRLAWLGQTEGEREGVEPLYDRVLVEVAREWLPGVERASIERRYLVDEGTGAVYREERLRGVADVSVGPCPRLVTVGFAEVEGGPAPQRIRLLQYVVAIDVGGSAWARVAEWAWRDFGAVAAAYRTALAEAPGLAEPFAVLAPAECDRDPGDDRRVLVDAAGAALPLGRAEDPAAARAVDALAAEHALEWVAGRLVHAGDALLVVPAAVAVRGDGGTVVRRIT